MTAAISELLSIDFPIVAFSHCCEVVDEVVNDFVNAIDRMTKRGSGM